MKPVLKIRSSASILVGFFFVGWQHNNDLYPVRFRFVEYRFPCNGKRTKKPDFVHDQCGSNGLSIVARIHSYSISSLLGISWLALHFWTVVGRFKYDNINCQRSIVLLSDSGFFKSLYLTISFNATEAHVFIWKQPPLSPEHIRKQCSLSTVSNLQHIVLFVWLSERVLRLIVDFFKI